MAIVLGRLASDDCADDLVFIKFLSDIFWVLAVVSIYLRSVISNIVPSMVSILNKLLMNHHEFNNYPKKYAAHELIYTSLSHMPAPSLFIVYNHIEMLHYSILTLVVMIHFTRL